MCINERVICFQNNKVISQFMYEYAMTVEKASTSISSKAFSGLSSKSDHIRRKVLYRSCTQIALKAIKVHTSPAHKGHKYKSTHVGLWDFKEQLEIIKKVAGILKGDVKYAILSHLRTL